MDIPTSKIWLPRFSPPYDRCRNCDKLMCKHDYIYGQWLCVAETARAMQELLDTVTDCEKMWQFDLDHGFLTAAEARRFRTDF